MQAHSSGARLPLRARLVIAQARQLLPMLPAVNRAEHGRVLDPGIDGVRIVQRRLQMPDPGELPGMWRAVVPLMRTRDPVVAEFVSHRLPGLTAVVGPLDLLAEPAGRLGQIKPVGVRGRALGVIDLPAPEMRAADIPVLPRAI